MSDNLDPNVSDTTTSSVTPTGMYDDQGRIIDPNIAQDIANDEYSAMVKEQRYTQEQKEGLTEQEKNNLEIVEILYEKYPHALALNINPDGYKNLSMKSTFPLAKHEPDYEASSQNIVGLGNPHKLFMSQLQNKTEDFSGLDPRINSILLHSLKNSDIAAVFSKDGIQYKDPETSNILTIRESLMVLTKKDVLALSRILAHNEALCKKEEERKEKAEKELIKSPNDIRNLLR